jgi:hypothetical protein
LEGTELIGNWSVVSTTGDFSSLDTPFGHNFNVTIKIEYKPSNFGKLVEPPILAWDEIIMVNNYAKPGRWEFTGNMYEHKPSSPTVAIWGRDISGLTCRHIIDPIKEPATTPKGTQNCTMQKPNNWCRAQNWVCTPTAESKRSSAEVSAAKRWHSRNQGA